VIDGRAGGFPVILENENVAEALVILQIQHAVPIAPEHIFHGRSGRVASVARWFGDSITTSCAPIPFHLVKETFSFAVQFASMPKAEICLGTTRMLQPGVFGPPPFRRRREFPAEFAPHCPRRRAILLFSRMTLSRRKSFGRFPRSVEMITIGP